tara:strand:+ start:1126 stop:3306 length:2181 start_codon:yes stop_codon:yes gene_type:complete
MDITLLRQMGLSADQLNKAGITPDMNRDEVVRRLNAANVGPPSAPSKPKEDSVQMPTAAPDPPPQDQPATKTADAGDEGGTGILAQLGKVKDQMAAGDLPFQYIMPGPARTLYQISRADDAIEGWKKLPGEFLQTATGIAKKAGEVYDQPEEEAKKGYDILSALARGGIDLAGQGLATIGLAKPQPVTEEGQAVAQIGKGIVREAFDVAKDPIKKWGESPTATLGVARMVLGPADPIGIGTRFAYAGAKNLTKKGLKTLKKRWAGETGAGEEALDIAYDIGRTEGFEGGPRTEQFEAARQGETPIETTYGRLTKAMPEVETFVSKRYNDAVQDIQKKYPDARLDLDGVKQEVLQHIDELRIDMVPKLNKDGEHIVDAYGRPEFDIVPRPNTRLTSLNPNKDLSPLKDLYMTVQAWDDSSIDGMHQLRLAIDELNKTTGKFSNVDVLDAAMNRARASLNNRIQSPDKPWSKEFAKADDLFSSAKTFVDQAKKNLGIKDADLRNATATLGLEDSANIPTVSSTLQTKLGNLLNDRTSQNLELSKAIVEEIDKAINRLNPGVYKGSIKDELAGIRLSSEGKLGIAKTHPRKGGTSVGAGGIGGLTYLGFSGDPLMSTALAAGLTGAMWGTSKVGRLLRSMSIDNPKSLGKMFRVFGASEKAAKDIEKWATNFGSSLKGKAAGLAQRGAALGVVINAMSEDDDILSTMGSIKRAPGSRGDFVGQSTQVMQ